VCTVSGSTVSFVGSGTCTINANQSGNGSYLAAPQVQQSFAVGLTAQTISFTSTPPSGAVAGGAGYTVTATASSGLAVAFTLSAGSAGVCTISGASVSFVGGGTCTVNANQPGNGSYQAAPQAQQSFTVAGSPPPKSPQTINFTSTAPAGATVGGSYTVTATASSGLAVAFSAAGSSAGVCTVSGSTVSFVGSGMCTINANQSGNGSYLAAPQKQQSFTIGLASQTISFTSTPPGSAVFGGAPYTVTATASSGLAVVFSAAPSSAGICTISGSTVSFVGAGTCTINANQSGNGSYQAAAQVQQSFSIGRASQTITITSDPGNNVHPQFGPYTITATSTSGLAVVFTTDPSSAGVCSVSGSTVTLSAKGQCIIYADQPGNANWLPAPQAQQSFRVK
jgi:hypothetical protein